MFSVLATFGPLKIYTLGFLIALGFLISSFLAWRRLRNLGLAEEKTIDLLVFLSFWSFLFSRLGYILIHFKDFDFFFDRWLLIGRYPGLTFWGAFIGSILVLARFCRKNNLSFWKISDEMVFSFLPLIVLIQIGCFFDGCLMGTPTSMPWGIFFPGDFFRRHPVAIFGALFYLLIWILLLRIERHWRTWKWYQSSQEGLISLVFMSLSFLAALLLAFIEEGGLYYLLFKKITSFLGLIVALIVFFGRCQIKIIKKRENEAD